jgi:sporulation protein YlmC with PRC-barrel domain
MNTTPNHLENSEISERRLGRKTPPIIFIIIFCALIVAAITYGFTHTNIIPETSSSEQGLVSKNIFDSPLNLDNMEHLDDFNLDKKQLLISAEPGSIFAGDDLNTKINNLKNSYILNDQGKIIGFVDKINFNENSSETLVFSLRKSLVPEDAPRTFELPANNVNVVKYNDKIYIQLTKTQTEALVDIIY